MKTILGRPDGPIVKQVDPPTLVPKRYEFVAVRSDADRAQGTITILIDDVEMFRGKRLGFTSGGDGERYQQQWPLIAGCFVGQRNEFPFAPGGDMLPSEFFVDDSSQRGKAFEMATCQRGLEIIFMLRFRCEGEVRGWVEGDALP